MADGRREHDYDVAINLAGYVNACLAGKFKPDSANPVRNARTEALIESKGDPKGSEAFAALRVGLSFIAESWPKDKLNGDG